MNINIITKGILWFITIFMIFYIFFQYKLEYEIHSKDIVYISIGITGLILIYLG